SNTLNTLSKTHLTLSHSQEITVSKSGVPIYAATILAIIFGFGLFFVGFDQGHLFSIVLGEQAFEDLYIHELTHDMRHAAGFPCH
ncbi:MAG: CbtB domain-containing protein, partial [Nitrosopumilaceae archaeon]